MSTVFAASCFSSYSFYYYVYSRCRPPPDQASSRPGSHLERGQVSDVANSCYGHRKAVHLHLFSSYLSHGSCDAKHHPSLSRRHTNRQTISTASDKWSSYILPGSDSSPGEASSVGTSSSCRDYSHKIRESLRGRAREVCVHFDILRATHRRLGWGSCEFLCHRQLKLQALEPNP